MEHKGHKWSHVMLCIACGVLIAFSLGSGMALFVTSAHLQDLSGMDGLTTYLLGTAIGASISAGAAVVCSWRQTTCFLHIYELLCLLLLISSTLLLAGILMLDAGGASADACYAPNSYFEFNMLQVSGKAEALLCSDTCPCPQHSRVQQCPAWTPTPYDTLM